MCEVISSGENDVNALNDIQGSCPCLTSERQNASNALHSFDLSNSNELT